MAITNPASHVTNTGARLNGIVNPDGLSTTYYFEWGTTASYGNTTLPNQQAVGQAMWLLQKT